MAVVLDASATLPWCFPDEATVDTELLLDRAVSLEVMHVTAHWPAEILNALTRAVRRGRLDSERVDTFLQNLSAYRIVVHSQPLPECWDESKGLIRKHRLSAYDAAYLALAIRLNIELATLDDQLRMAAQAEGVALAV